eukprot:CAMPEP_0194520048 /NCGR_PEP_ID=MMETSP0253-20130528/53912_1 /TAXON_ID=2966 /ORGANISM="Noctiluca scintillans" /LENGTH=527 /DNA_ID=CAMNT_0039364249 /DNA_START=1 /DNA_END=1584 /DNA_ORIENTATION=+
MIFLYPPALLWVVLRIGSADKLGDVGVDACSAEGVWADGCVSEEHSLMQSKTAARHKSSKSNAELQSVGSAARAVPQNNFPSEVPASLIDIELHCSTNGTLSFETEVKSDGVDSAHFFVDVDGIQTVWNMSESAVSGMWHGSGMSPSFHLEEGRHRVELLRVSGNHEIRNVQVYAPSCAAPETGGVSGLLARASSKLMLRDMVKRGLEHLPELQALSQKIRKSNDVSGVVMLLVVAPIIACLVALLAVAVVRFTGTSPRREITGMLDQMRGGQSAVSRRPDRRQSDASLFAQPVPEMVPTQGSQRNTMQEADAMTVLCPQLTVPSNSECVLAVPSLLDVEHGSLVSRNLTDKDGLPLLRVGLSFTTRDPVADLPSCEYVLLAAQSDEQELAFCQLQMKEEGERFSSATLFRWDGHPFARLMEDPISRAGRTFAVSSVSGRWHIRFQGSFEERKVSVLNERGELIAMAERRDESFTDVAEGSYKLRMGPHVDSGVVILTMLSIDRIFVLEERLSPKLKSGRFGFGGSM